MNPTRIYCNDSHLKIKMYKINGMGFKEVITIYEGFESAMERQGFKRYIKG